MLALSVGSHAADTSIVGEWAVDESSCAESRLVFDAEGRHSAILMEDGVWRTLGSARYQVEGKELIIQQGESLERVSIKTHSAEALTLHNPDSLLGPITTTFVRCRD